MSGIHMGSRASARSVGRYDPEGDLVGVSFTDENGNVIYLNIDRKSALFLLDSLSDSLTGYRDVCQKLKSSGIPRSDGSPEEGHVQ